jgi:hypothetical protein
MGRVLALKRPSGNWACAIVVAARVETASAKGCMVLSVAVLEQAIRVIEPNRHIRPAYESQNDLTWMQTM